MSKIFFILLIFFGALNCSQTDNSDIINQSSARIAEYIKSADHADGSKIINKLIEIYPDKKEEQVAKQKLEEIAIKQILGSEIYNLNNLNEIELLNITKLPTDIIKVILSYYDLDSGNILHLNLKSLSRLQDVRINVRYGSRIKAKEKFDDEGMCMCGLPAGTESQIEDIKSGRYLTLINSEFSINFCGVDKLNLPKEINLNGEKYNLTCINITQEVKFIKEELRQEFIKYYTPPAYKHRLDKALEKDSIYYHVGYIILRLSDYQENYSEIKYKMGYKYIISDCKNKAEYDIAIKNGSLVNKADSSSVFIYPIEFIANWFNISKKFSRCFTIDRFR